MAGIDKEVVEKEQVVFEGNKGYEGQSLEGDTEEQDTVGHGQSFKDILIPVIGQLKFLAHEYEDLAAEYAEG